MSGTLSASRTSGRSRCEQLVLQRLGAGRDDDLAAGEQRRHEVGEGLAGAGAGFGEQGRALGDRLRDRLGHRQLLGAKAISRQARARAGRRRPNTAAKSTAPLGLSAARLPRCAAAVRRGRQGLVSSPCAPAWRPASTGGAAARARIASIWPAKLGIGCVDTLLVGGVRLAGVPARASPGCRAKSHRARAGSPRFPCCAPIRAAPPGTGARSTACACRCRIRSWRR